MNLDRLKAELTRDEGYRTRLYKDSVGKWTIGIGHNIDDKGVSPAVVDLMFREDVAEAEADLDRELPFWRTLDEVRQRVMLNWCFNVGIGVPGGPHGLLSFKNTLSCIEVGAYATAAEGMERSLWARQVGPRATRLAEMMRTGKEPA